MELTVPRVQGNASVENEVAAYTGGQTLTGERSIDRGRASVEETVVTSDDATDLDVAAVELKMVGYTGVIVELESQQTGDCEIFGGDCAPGEIRVILSGELQS